MRFYRPILVSSGLLCCALNLHAELVNGIKVIVHDSVITLQQVESLTEIQADELRKQYRNQPDVFEQKINAALNESLQQLTERQLILHDFKAGGYTLPETILDEEVEKRIRARFGDRATATKTLQAQGETFEKFRQRMKEQIIIEALQYKNVSSDIIVSPHSIEAYYTAHQDQFKVAEEVRLRMIVLNKPSDSAAQQTTRARADEILSKIKASATPAATASTFAEMASVYSEGSQRSQGGDWGWTERSVLRKELAEAAFALKAGDVSDVIDTPEALYLMLVEDKRPGHVRPLNEVRADIEKTMVTEERARLQKVWIDRLRKKTFVRSFNF